MYNFEAYKQALAGLSSLPCYAVKVGAKWKEQDKGHM